MIGTGHNDTHIPIWRGQAQNFDPLGRRDLGRICGKILKLSALRDWSRDRNLSRPPFIGTSWQETYCLINWDTNNYRWICLPRGSKIAPEIKSTGHIAWTVTKQGYPQTWFYDRDRPQWYPHSHMAWTGAKFRPSWQAWFRIYSQ